MKNNLPKSFFFWKSVAPCEKWAASAPLFLFPLRSIFCQVINLLLWLKTFRFLWKKNVRWLLLCWSLIRKKVQFREAALFVSKFKRLKSIFLKFFGTQRHQKNPRVEWRIIFQKPLILTFYANSTTSSLN